MARFELQKLYIDGGYSDAGSDATFEAINPATVKSSPMCNATKEDVERAVVSAEKGQKIWAAMTAMERSRILRRAVDILRERNDELAALETLDTGKPSPKPNTSTSSPAPTCWNTTQAWCPPSKASRSRCATPPSSTPAASRWAWSPVSARGTTRSRSPCGNPPRPWPPATR
jgi:hypothetical protein